MSLYSGMIELIQPYVNRFADFEDYIFNNLGMIIGFVLGSFIKNLIEN